MRKQSNENSKEINSANLAELRIQKRLQLANTSSTLKLKLPISLVVAVVVRRTRTVPVAMRRLMISLFLMMFQSKSTVAALVRMHQMT